MFSRNFLRGTFSAVADRVFSGWKSYPLPIRQKTCGGADLPLKIWTAVIVFVGSYLPLSVILLIQDFDAQDKATVWLVVIPKLKHPMLSVGLLLIASSCLVLSIVFLGLVQPKRSIEIKSTKYIPTDMINYSFPYIVSFMSLSFDDPQKLLGLFVFMIILFLITYRSGRIFVILSLSFLAGGSSRSNIVLLGIPRSLTGWHLQEGAISR